MSALLEAELRPATAAREIVTERFVPLAVHPSAVRRAITRLRWPLGTYTTPVALVILWEVLSRIGVLSDAVAPAPTTILGAGWDLYQQGDLVPSIATSRWLMPPSRACWIDRSATSWVTSDSAAAP